MGIGKTVMTVLYLALSAALVLCLSLAPGLWGWGELQAEEEAAAPVNAGSRVITPQQAQAVPPATSAPRASSGKKKAPAPSSKSGSGSGSASADGPAAPIEIKVSSEELTLRQGDSCNLVFDYDPEDPFRWYYESFPQDGVIGACAEFFYPDPLKEGGYKIIFKFTAAEAGTTEFELVYRNHHYFVPVVLKRHAVKVSVVEAGEGAPYLAPPETIALRYGETWRVALDLPDPVDGEPERDLRLAEGWDRRVLQLKGFEHVVPPGGGRGFYLWTFRAVGPGMAELKVEQFVKGREDEAAAVYTGKATVYCPTPRQREIDVEASGEFTLRFDADAGAGYHWDLKTPPDETRLKFLGKETLEVPGSTLGWVEVWRFQAMAAGKTDFAVAYRPSDLDPVETVTIHLTVR